MILSELRYIPSEFNLIPIKIIIVISAISWEHKNVSICIVDAWNINGVVHWLIEFYCYQSLLININYFPSILYMSLVWFLNTITSISFKILFYFFQELLTVKWIYIFWWFWTILSTRGIFFLILIFNSFRFLCIFNNWWAGRRFIWLTGIIKSW